MPNWKQPEQDVWAHYLRKIIQPKHVERRPLKESLLIWWEERTAPFIASHVLKIGQIVAHKEPVLNLHGKESERHHAENRIAHPIEGSPNEAILAACSIAKKAEPNALNEVERGGEEAPKGELNKELVVMVPHAVCNPRTVMVKPQDASTALSAVSRSLWFPRIAVLTKLFLSDSVLERNFPWFGKRGPEVSQKHHDSKTEH